jgi:transposase
MRKIETKKLTFVNSKSLLVTLDIGKENHYGYCRCPDRTEIKPFEFSNNRAGFEKLWACIAATKTAKGLEEVIVGFESTGCYGEPLVHFLKDRPVKLVQVNPMHTKRLKELQGNSPGKTDWKDPKVIADIIEFGHSLTVVIPHGSAAELRRLTQARERTIKRRTAMSNQLQDLVFISFPEFLTVMRGVKSKSARRMLQTYPSPLAILEAGIGNVAAFLKQVSRGKLGMDRAKTLYEAAGQSVGITEGRFSVIFEIKVMLEEMANCESQIKQVEREMSRYLDEIPYSHLILSMKGIGRVTTAGIIGEVGDFSKFHTQNEIFKHAGLDLFEISSGQHKGSKRISKRGRSQLRKQLFFAAINTIRKGGIMHEQYQEHLRKGMKKLKALVAIARKLLGVIFALVRTDCEYQLDYRDVMVAQRLKKAA